jgi:hypothetical protein
MHLSSAMRLACVIAAGRSQRRSGGAVRLGAPAGATRSGHLPARPRCSRCPGRRRSLGRGSCPLGASRESGGPKSRDFRRWWAPRARRRRDGRRRPSPERCHMLHDRELHRRRRRIAFRKRMLWAIYFSGPIPVRHDGAAGGCVMARMTSCKACGAMMSADARICPRCGANFNRITVVQVGLAIMLAIVVLYALFDRYSAG